MSKILYVEDNPDNFRLVKTLLEKSGYTVVGASDGLEAITRAKQGKPDLILMDINIPSLSGYEVTTKIKSIEGLEKVPIVAVTAKTMKSDRDMAIAAGCVGFISKPIDPFVFVDEIESYLKGRKVRIADSEEQFLLREYSRKLVANLEDKVTQLLRSNIKLQESEKRYKTLIEHVNTGIWQLTKGFETIYVNQKLLELLGCTESECIKMENVFDKNCMSISMPYLENCLKGLPQTWEVTFEHPKNGLRQLLISGVAVETASGEIDNFIMLSIIDITERKQLEKHISQIHKMEIMSTLSAGLSHDFNNILSIIINNLHLLKENAKHELSEENFKRILSIYDAAQRGKGMVSKLLSFSRQSKANIQEEDIVEIVSNFCTFFKSYSKPNINIQFTAEKNIPHVKADKEQIEQVLLNLTTNSQDAMPDGGTITLELKTGIKKIQNGNPEKSEPKNVVIICIKDTGTGIEKEVLEKIYEPFFTTKPQGKGTGLGLSAVFGIVKKHGGYIECESTPGLGTEFKIYLPAIFADKNNIPKNITYFKGKDLKCIVIDDDELLRELIGEMLDELGVEATCLKNMKEAEDFIGKTSHHLDFIIVDFALKKDNEAEKIINILKNHFTKIKIILMSGYKIEDIKRNVELGNIDIFLKKPFTMAELSHVIKKII